MPDGSRARSTRTSGHQSLLAVRAGEEARRLAGVLRDEGERDEADGEERRDLVEERAGDAFDVGRPRELAGDPPQALELPLALRRARRRRTRSAPTGDRTASRPARPSASAPMRTATLSHASARPFRPTGNDSIELIWASRFYGASVALEQCFQAAERDPSAFKRWAVPAHCGPRERRDSVPRTGRCEPRARTWPCTPR